jgi:hypothetical protein
MEESLRVYSTIKGFMGQTGLVFNDTRNFTTFVWAVVGLLLSKEIALSQWLLYRTSGAKAASKERQLARWLHNAKIEPNQVYRNLISAALVEWQTAELEIALDTSVLWERFVLVRLAAIYRGRGLPLGWLVLEQKSASVSFANYAALLRTVACLLPAPCRVVLLADRGFMDIELMQLAVDLNWHFTLRAKHNLWVYRAFRPRCKLERLMPPKGHIHLLPVVQVSEQRFGPVALALGHMRTKHGYEQWALLSDRPPTLETFDEYGRRFDIEENFLDDKSAGFQLEASQLNDATALSRLCLILAAATLYLVSTGTAITTLHLRSLVDTHWQRGLSYFQIGWRWLHFALAHAHLLVARLWLEPGPDPQLVFASRRQPFTLAFSAIYLFDD